MIKLLREKTGAVLYAARIPVMSICLLAVIGGGPVFADEPQVVKRSIRALGMGNAFVAVANDENSLYYNPAGLKSVRQTIFEILTLSGSVNQSTIDFAQKSGDDQSAVIGELVGEKIRLDGNIVLASITGTGWGYSLFGNVLFDGKVRNPTVPYFDLTAYVQYGAIGGLAFSFLDKTLDAGVSMKSVSRQGIGKELHIVDFLDEDFASELESDFATQTAVTPDVGLIYRVERFYNLEPRLAVVVRNIGGMDFGSSGEIPMSIDLGVATESELAGFDVLLAADWTDITYATTEYKSSMRNLNLGMEIGLARRGNNHHALALRAGRKGSYPTFGFSFNPPYIPIMLDYASWSEEVGNVAGDIEDQRHTFQISFNF